MPQVYVLHAMQTRLCPPPHVGSWTSASLMFQPLVPDCGSSHRLPAGLWESFTSCQALQQRHVACLRMRMLQLPASTPACSVRWHNAQRLHLATWVALIALTGLCLPDRRMACSPCYARHGIDPPSHQAAAVGAYDIVEQLLDCGAQLEDTDAQHRTALHHACRGGHVETARLLVRRGAAKYAKTLDGETPMVSHGSAAVQKASSLPCWCATQGKTVHKVLDRETPMISAWKCGVQHRRGLLAVMLVSAAGRPQILQRLWLDDTMCSDVLQGGYGS